mmetsp:Transcript_3418/g.7076  ORF Transcript_3418/g.7076 Transcript_3418/m.7076 type:complete len:92 (+) Transcript_3418:253-528(+)
MEFSEQIEKKKTKEDIRIQCLRPKAHFCSPSTWQSGLKRHPPFQFLHPDRTLISAVSALQVNESIHFLSPNSSSYFSLKPFIFPFAYLLNL